jgi:hypothetical protein
MSLYRYDIQQNTQEWITAKLGKFSASSAAELLMKNTNEGYKNLIKRIVEERITGEPIEGRWNGNKFTERGHDFEPMAIERFELSTFTKVNRVGIVEMNEWVCCSPDGLINENGLIQVKNPIFSTQYDYLFDIDGNLTEISKPPTNYYKQMQFELFITEREYNIFYSVHPKLPEIKIKIYRDETLIKEIQDKLVIAINEVQKRIEQIRSS